MKIVRIWLYRVMDVYADTEVKPSKTNQTIKRVTRGEFKYYKLEGETVLDSTNQEAKDWASKTGQAIETWRGYPAFMHDMGYRV